MLLTCCLKMADSGDKPAGADHVIKGVEGFDKSKLKNVKTEVHDTLPTKETIAQEKAAK